MRVKFRVVYDDGTYLDSHDENWNEVCDHASALPPFNEKKWLEYQLVADNGKFVAVNFKTGIFNINGQIVHPAEIGGGALTNKSGPSNYDLATEPWSFLKDLPYFPVVGRRNWSGDTGVARAYFCGWKRKEGEVSIEKLCLMFGDMMITDPDRKDVMPTGSILFT